MMMEENTILWSGGKTNLLITKSKINAKGTILYLKTTPDKPNTEYTSYHRFYSDMGYNFISFDYPGYFGNDGDTKYESLNQCVMAVIDFVSKSYKDVILFGFGTGCYEILKAIHSGVTLDSIKYIAMYGPQTPIGIQYTNEQKIEMLNSINEADKLNDQVVFGETAKERIESFIFHDMILFKRKFQIFGAMKDNKIPLKIITGSMDSEMDINVIENYFGEYGRIVTIDGFGTEIELAQFPELLEIVQDIPEIPEEENKHY